MSKAQFLFTKNQDSVSVYIENLEQLSVAEIQKIEKFVTTRKGILDFHTYTFFLPKKLNMDIFISLLWHVGIDATCEEKVTQKSVGKRIEFGQYKGMLYSEIPDSYLIWLKSSYRGADRDIIDEELKFRSK